MIFLLQKFYEEVISKKINCHAGRNLAQNHAATNTA